MTSPAVTPRDDAWWTAENTAKVVSLAGYKYPKEMLAGYLGVDPDHLTGARFEEAVARGLAIAEAAVAQALFGQAKEGKPTAVRMWRDRPSTLPYQAKPGKAATDPVKPGRNLSPKRQRFVEEYPVDMNATQAAIRAGYSTKTARSIGHELLTIPDVQAAIAEVMHKRSAKVEATVERVLEELGYIGFADLRHFVTIDQHGQPYLDLSNLPDGASRAISEVTTESRTYFQGEVEHRVQKTKLKLHPKNSALDLLGRHLKMWIQRHEHSGPEGGPIPVEEVTPEKLRDKVLEALATIRRQRDEGREAIGAIPPEALPSAPKVDADGQGAAPGSDGSGQ